MQIKVLTIINPEGFHVRPAQMFVDLSSQFEAEIIVKNAAGKEVDGKSMLGLMTLELGAGSNVVVQAIGADEAEAINGLSKLIESGFGEINQ